MSASIEGTAGGGRYLIVRTGAERFAVPAAAVAAVQLQLTVYPVPGGRAPLLGLGQHAGEPLVVVDLLELVDEKVGGHQAVVVLRRAGANRQAAVGLAVDEAERIVALAGLVPGEDEGTGVRALANVSGHRVRVVDPALIADAASDPAAPMVAEDHEK